MNDAARAQPDLPQLACLEALGERFAQVRARTEALCAPLQPEDCVIQSMTDVSPPKWHLAHVSWFFEAFILTPYAAGYQSPDTRYDHLFNSYYQTHGQPFARERRGLLSRPGLEQVMQYRQHVDQAMLRLIEAPAPEHAWEIVRRTELGLQHEQQHQELLLMDIKHILAQNPLNPAYRNDLAAPSATAISPTQWISFPAGLRQIGHAGADFAFDCEMPRHRQFLDAFELADRPVNNADYLAFMQDGGYQRSELWLADGWALIQQHGWRAPLYWQQADDGDWQSMGLAGLQPLERSAPVCHISFYEADAFARWAGARLPTEGEWEVAARDEPLRGNFLESDLLQPRGDASGGLRQLYGDVWEWTSSAFLPYPGFAPLAGSLGEYNGKFMSGQRVLRGGSCATPEEHIRATYRNFFYPHMRWQFAGLRLARDA